MMTLMESLHGIPYTWNLLRWVSHLMVMMLLNVIMVMVMMMEAQHGMESSEKGEISAGDDDSDVMMEMMMMIMEAQYGMECSERDVVSHGDDGDGDGDDGSPT